MSHSVCAANGQSVWKFSSLVITTDRVFTPWGQSHNNDGILKVDCNASIICSTEP